MRFSAKKVALVGILGALTCVLTMFPKIPVPATEGYIHLGDSVVFIAATVLDPLSAILSAGIGSMLADFFSGYAHWMLPTLVIKSTMALLISLVVQKGFTKTKFSLGMFASGIIMIAGYYVASAIMKGNWHLPLASVPFNIAQFIAGFIVAFLVVNALLSRGIIKRGE